jgi:hypothetical protein
MTNCRLCGRVIEATVAKCPHCDATRVPDLPREGPNGEHVLLSFVVFPFSVGFWLVYYVIFGRSRSSRSPEPEDATTRRLKTARAVGGLIAVSGIGILSCFIAIAATGTLVFGAGLLLVGGMSAYYAHRNLKLNRQREQAFDLRERDSA